MITSEISSPVYISDKYGGFTTYSVLTKSPQIIESKKHETETPLKTHVTDAVDALPVIELIVVRRRYSDFIWLSNVLHDNHPDLILPVLSNTKYFNRFSSELIESRMRLMQTFLHRITLCPGLINNPIVEMFLQQKDDILFSQQKEIITKRINVSSSSPVAQVGSMPWFKKVPTPTILVSL